VRHANEVRGLQFIASLNEREILFMNVRKLSKERGQGMTEYIIIVALIAVAAIGVYSYFGQTVRNQTAAIAQEVSGQDSANVIQSSKDSANTAKSKAAAAKGMAAFDGNQ
jgi:Flp pilus assembly pilin Flp